MEVRNVRWVGIRTDAYEAMVGFLRDVLGLRVNFAEPVTTEFTTSEGDEVQVMGPGHPSYEFFGEQANGPVPLLEVDDVHSAAAISRLPTSRSWARPSTTAAGTGYTSAPRTGTSTSSPVACLGLEEKPTAPQPRGPKGDVCPSVQGISLEGRGPAEFLDHRLPRGAMLLERNQDLDHDILPALVELADHVGADLARGREDGEKVRPRPFSGRVR